MRKQTQIATIQLLNANFFLVLKLLSKQNMHLFDSILMAVFASVVDHGFEHRSAQAKDYKISMCCFSVCRARSIKK
jgi:hypothetical protein